MFGVVWSVSVGPKCIFVFFKPLCEALSRLPYIRLVAIGHVSLYAPDLLYLSRVWGFGISSFWRVLLLRSVILRSAFLKRFVIKVVSLPMYMKGAHFCVVVSVFWLEVMVGCLGAGAMCVWTGNPLFSIMSWMVSSSSLYSSFCRW